MFDDEATQSIIKVHAIVDYCVDGELRRLLARQAQELGPGDRLCIELSRVDAGAIDIRSFVMPAAQPSPA